MYRVRDLSDETSFVTARHHSAVRVGERLEVVVGSDKALRAAQSKRRQKEYFK